MSIGSAPSKIGPTQQRRCRATVPEAVWGPLAVGSLLSAIGLIGLAAGQPWLFPSLGPTAFLQAEEPGARSSRFYNTILGHTVGLGAGLAAVFLLGASSAPACWPVANWVRCVSGRPCSRRL
jgi:hypothetical protein